MLYESIYMHVDTDTYYALILLDNDSSICFMGADCAMCGGGDMLG